MNKRNFKIIRFYIISIVCIVFYFLLENLDINSELVKASENWRYGSFPTFFLSGLIKYGLLVVGVSIIVITSILLIKERFKKAE
jgi:hypothetical protein